MRTTALHRLPTPWTLLLPLLLAAAVPAQAVMRRKPSLAKGRLPA